MTEYQPTNPNPAPTGWAPINDYDNFNPIPEPPNPWNATFPSYEVTGQWPAVTGIPAGNPATLVVKLCRVVDQGSTDGTFKLRTYDGWLLDNFSPHTSSTMTQGMFVLVLFCGQWCFDIGYDN